jgi:Pseudouridylate synthases, 23S RNA-specific
VELTNRDFILYEDEEIIVCHKQAGIAVQTSRVGEEDLENILKKYLKAPYLGVIHRLDQPVEGILAFAKTKQAAAKLSAQNKGDAMNKDYYAMAALAQPRETGREYRLTDYLLKKGKGNISQVVEAGAAGAKRAELAYQIMDMAKRKEKTESGIAREALVKIRLVTGRHHQIRVQLSHAGLPLLGDSKYGNEISKNLSLKLGIRNVALCAYRLEFFHPSRGKRLAFEIEPCRIAFWSFFLPDNS